MQVLSKSVADALAYFGDEEPTETEKFFQMFDRFKFDCMNVRNISEWKSKLKPDFQPYTNTDDCRIKVRSTAFTFWLQMNFLFITVARGQLSLIINRLETVCE